MNLTQRLISTGFALCALASASVPALAWTVWPDVDFEWYANVGKPIDSSIEVFPAPRAGFIWSPGHYERVAGRSVWAAGQWIKDDYAEQVALYSNGNASVAAAGPMTLYDRQGEPIPTNPESYPIDSSRIDSSRR
jgi:hypothetical protein